MSYYNMPSSPLPHTPSQLRGVDIDAALELAALEERYASTAQDDDNATPEWLDCACTAGSRETFSWSNMYDRSVVFDKWLHMKSAWSTSSDTDNHVDDDNDDDGNDDDNDDDGNDDDNDDDDNDDDNALSSPDYTVDDENEESYYHLPSSLLSTLALDGSGGDEADRLYYHPSSLPPSPPSDYDEDIDLFYHPSTPPPPSASPDYNVYDGNEEIYYHLPSTLPPSPPSEYDEHIQLFYRHHTPPPPSYAPGYNVHGGIEELYDHVPSWPLHSWRFTGFNAMLTALMRT